MRAALLALVACTHAPSSTSPIANATPVEAPAVRVFTLHDRAGKSYVVPNGQPCVVAFFVTYALGGLGDAVQLSKLAPHYRGKVQFFAVNADPSLDSPAVDDYIESSGVTIPVLDTTATVKAAFGKPAVVPTMLLFDRDGIRIDVDVHGSQQLLPLAATLDELTRTN